jgi:chromosome segregation ATPase
MFTLVVLLNVLWSGAIGNDVIPALNTPLWIITPCIVTMTLYFSALLCAARLNQRQIDSVYYLGFLTTLAVLGVSAYSLTSVSSSGGLAIQTAGAQFALGLLATGLGLFFRLRLQEKAAAAASTGELLDKYVDTIGRLSDRMNEAAHNFERLTNETIQSASDTSRKTAIATLANITEALQPVVHDLRTSVTSINRSLKKFDPAQMRVLTDSIQGLGRMMGELSTAMPSVRVSIEAFQSEIDRSTKSQTLSVSANEMMNGALSTMVGNLDNVRERLTGLHETFRECESQFGKTSEAQSGYAQSAEKVATTLHTAATALVSVTAGMNQTGKELKQLVVSLDSAGMKEISSTLKETIERLSRMNAEVDSFATSVGAAHAGVGTHLNRLTVDFDKQIREINDAATALGNAMMKMSATLSRSVEDAMRY